MMRLEDSLAAEYLIEAHADLAIVNTDIRSFVEGRAEIGERWTDPVLRAVHSVKRAASLFELDKICSLATQTEGLLTLIRSRNLVVRPDLIRALLGATTRLAELMQNPAGSGHADITQQLKALESESSRNPATEQPGFPKKAGQTRQSEPQLRILLVEDDFASRLLLQTFLSRYGECDIAANGMEAVEAFRSALDGGQKYDLICMDIMMPVMDGRDAVRQIRDLEAAHGITSTRGAKIIMTTAVDDLKEVAQCFHELCDAYLTKPIDLSELLQEMRVYQLVR